MATLRDLLESLAAKRASSQGLASMIEASRARELEQQKMDMQREAMRRQEHEPWSSYSRSQNRRVDIFTPEGAAEARSAFSQPKAEADVLNRASIPRRGVTEVGATSRYMELADKWKRGKLEQEDQKEYDLLKKYYQDTMDEAMAGYNTQFNTAMEKPNFENIRTLAPYLEKNQEDLLLAEEKAKMQEKMAGIRSSQPEVKLPSIGNAMGELASAAEKADMPSGQRAFADSVANLSTIIQGARGQYTPQIRATAGRIADRAMENYMRSMKIDTTMLDAIKVKAKSKQPLVPKEQEILSTVQSIENLKRMAGE